MSCMLLYCSSVGDSVEVDLLDLLNSLDSWLGSTGSEFLLFSKIPKTFLDKGNR